MRQALQENIRDRVKAIDPSLQKTLWGDGTVPVTLEGMTVTTGGQPSNDNYDCLLTMKGIARVIIVNEAETDLVEVLADFAKKPVSIEPVDNGQSWSVQGMLNGIDEQRDEAGLVYTSILFTVNGALHQILELAFEPKTIESKEKETNA